MLFSLTDGYTTLEQSDRMGDAKAAVMEREPQQVFAFPAKNSRSNPLAMQYVVTRVNSKAELGLALLLKMMVLLKTNM